MSVTTIAAIRDRMETVIRGLTPQSLSGDLFAPSQNAGDGNFRDWAAGSGAAALRRFQVRDVGDMGPPMVSNMDIERRDVIFEVIIAYPQSHRYGAQGAIDRDDVIEMDTLQIEGAIGWRGGQNFQGSSPNASWVSGTCARERYDPVDFLVFRNIMSFYRST